MFKKQKGINESNKNDEKCFQYAVPVVLNCKEIENHPKRVTKIQLTFFQNQN